MREAIVIARALASRAASSSAIRSRPFRAAHSQVLLIAQAFASSSREALWIIVTTARRVMLYRTTGVALDAVANVPGLLTALERRAGSSRG